jgi:hypothetical protein
MNSRRNFLKVSAAGAAGAVLTSQVGSVVGAPSATLDNGPGNKWPGRVVINFNKGAMNVAGVDSQSVITKMVDDSILRLTDAATVGAAWKSVFPASLTAASKIAMKVPVGYNQSKSAPNCYVIKGIVDGLAQMDFNGTKFPAANIYIYDQNGANGFSSIGVTNTLLPNVHILYSSNGSGYTDGANGMQYAQPLHDCDFLITCPSIRGHWAEMGNVTIGFKSHYGTYGPVHGNGAPAYLRDINCTGPVYKKNVITVVSAIFGQNLGNGPGGSPEAYTTYAQKIDPSSTAPYGANTIVMSTDPVSADMQAIKIMRMNQGQAFDTNSMPPYLKISGGIASSYAGTSLSAMNIGVIAEASMDIRRIINGNATAVLTPSQKASRGGFSLIASHLKESNGAFI